jgi:predicted PurR-regulated permease PerM
VDAPTTDVSAPPWLARTIRRSIWSVVAAVLITLVGVWFLGQSTTLLRYLFVSQLLAFALEPAVAWFHDTRGWRRGSATGLILAGLFLFMVVLVALLVPVITQQIDSISKNVPAWIDNINSFTQDHFNTTLVSSSGIAESTQSVNNATNYLQEHSGDILGAIGGILGGIFALFTIGLFTFYLTANGPKVRRTLLSRVPPERQRHLLWAWETAIHKTGGYLYSRLLLALINGGLMFVTLKIVGAPFALPLSLFEGIVAEFIPIVGTYVAGAVPVVVTLAAVGPVPALVVLVEILVYQQLENYYLSPHISQKTIELNAGIAFAAAMAGGSVGGFVGAFFALPIAAIIQAFLSTYSKRYDIVDSRLTHGDEAAAPKESRRQRRRDRRSSADEAATGDGAGADRAGDAVAAKHAVVVRPAEDDTAD